MININQVHGKVKQDCSVVGLRGKYSYDINRVYITKQKIIINGWGLLNSADGNSEVHNIAPSFTLELIPTNEEKVIIKNISQKYVFQNTVKRWDYSDKNACYGGVKDFTYALWYKGASGVGFCSYGPQTYYSQMNCQDRATSDFGLCAKNEEDRNKMNFLYIDLDFQYEIPIADIEALAKQGARRIYFKMTIKTEGGGKTVYGKPIQTVSREETFYLSIPEQVVESDFSVRNSELNNIVSGIQNTVSHVTVSTQYGRVQATDSLGTTRYFAKKDSGIGADILITSSGTKLYYQQGVSHKITGSPVLGVKTGPLIINNSDIMALKLLKMYPVEIKRDCTGNGNNLKCTQYVVDSKGATPKYVAYVPAIWSSPLCKEDDATNIEIEEQYACETDNKCVPRPTLDCPKNCCEEICKKIKGNENTPFCKECYPPGPVPEPICAYTDALAQYCCLYPNDRELCDDLIKPQKESNSRSSSCLIGSSIQEEYKHPQIPNIKTMGHPKLDNNACRISCQEQLVINFERQPHIKAGMGFEYPVGIKGERICGAEYKNEAWVNKRNAAVKLAEEHHKTMVAYLRQANALADICGDKEAYNFTVSASKSCGPVCGGCSVSCDCSCPSTYNYTNFNPGYAYNNNSDNKTKYLGFSNFNERRMLVEEGDVDPCPQGYGEDSCECESNCTQYFCEDSGKRWDTAQKQIKGELDKASIYKKLHDQQVAIIEELDQHRRTCDNWVQDNTYMSDLKTKITTTNLKNEKLASQPSYTVTKNNYTITDSYFENRRSYTNKNFKYLAETFKKHGVPKSGHNNFNMNYFDNSVFLEYSETTRSYRDVWVKKSTRDLEYRFINHYYIQKYTGALSLQAQSGYVSHGRYFYTDFFDETATHNFNLKLIEIGPNISRVNKTWQINSLFCNYNVTNWIFPPEGDPQNDLFGSVAFRYRTISLNDPFPNNRRPGSNWDLGDYNIQSIMKPRNPSSYYVSLTFDARRSIRNYNENKKKDYTTFYSLDPDKSDLFTIRQMFKNQNELIIKPR